MCYHFKRPTRDDTFANFAFGMTCLCIVVALAILFTAELRPSVDYQYHRSEIVNWGWRAGS